LRHLGVADYGRYRTDVALLGLVLGLTDSGLTTIGIREIAVATTKRDREEIASAMMGLRLVVTTVGVIAAIAFAYIAYDRVMVVGTMVVGISVILIALQSMATVPLFVSLRIVPTTILEIGRYVLTFAFVALLVFTGAELLPFFFVQIPIALALAAATVLYVRRTFRLRMSFNLHRIKSLLRQALPQAIASTLVVAYLGSMVIIVSLLASPVETGLYATSARVMEMLIMLPGLVISLALPIMAVSSVDDRARFRTGLQDIFETVTLFASLIVMGLVILAPTVIAIIGGAAFADAGPVLRLQSLALLGMFISYAFGTALIAMREQRRLVVANSIGFTAVVILGVALVSEYGAMGGALAVIGAEVCLVVTLVILMHRCAPDVAPRFGYIWKPALAGAAGVAMLLIPGISPWLAVVLGTVAFIVIALATRAIPVAVGRALVPANRRTELVDTLIRRCCRP
jgi:O-antigen/teichoic acid export membrane protein